MGPPYAVHAQGVKVERSRNLESERVKMLAGRINGGHRCKGNRMLEGDDVRSTGTEHREAREAEGIRILALKIGRQEKSEWYKGRARPDKFTSPDRESGGVGLQKKGSTKKEGLRHNNGVTV